MRVLLLAHGNWLGPARFPQALKHVGAEVALICKKGDMASMSRFVDRMVFVDTSKEREILEAIDRVVREWNPALILPGTDVMVSTLIKYRLMATSQAIDLTEAKLPSSTNRWWHEIRIDSYPERSTY